MSLHIEKKSKFENLNSKFFLIIKHKSDNFFANFENKFAKKTEVNFFFKKVPLQGVAVGQKMEFVLF